MDELLNNILQYWLSGTSVRAVSYREEWVSPSLKPDQQVEVLVAIPLPPKSLGPYSATRICRAELEEHSALDTL